MSQYVDNEENYIHYFLQLLSYEEHIKDNSRKNKTFTIFTIVDNNGLQLEKIKPTKEKDPTQLFLNAEKSITLYNNLKRFFTYESRTHLILLS